MRTSTPCLFGLLVASCAFDGSGLTGIEGLDPADRGGPRPVEFADRGASNADSDAPAPSDARPAESPSDSCPDSCPAGCLPGEGRCLVPSNVLSRDLEGLAPCTPVRVAAGETWTLCAGSEVCAIVSGEDCASPAACVGRPVAQRTATPQGHSVRACVFSLAALEVEQGGRLRGTGPLPIILLARQRARVAGVLDLSAQDRAAGPGGGAGGSSTRALLSRSGQPGKGPMGLTTWLDAPLGGGHALCVVGDDSGGGGGGYASEGAVGGVETGCAQGGRGGVTYGAGELMPLVGGSGGGGAGDGTHANTSPGVGGGGGGAIQISTPELEIAGVIAASGGSGGGGVSDDGYPVAGGGGGSGGAVLLEASLLRGNGTIMAAGGGGGGGGFGGPGCASSGQTASADDPERMPLGGGSCNELCSWAGGACGAGGAGASGMAILGVSPLGAPALPGADARTGGAGGGGGGAGYIRLNLIGADASTCPSAPGLKIHGMLSCGRAAAAP